MIKQHYLNQTQHEYNFSHSIQKMRYLRSISPNLSKIYKTLIPNPNFTRQCASAAQQSNPPPASDTVRALVDEISQLTLLETADLTEVLRIKLDVKEMPIMAIMMPGMGLSGLKGAGKGAGAAAAKGEEKVEKTVFDVKLEGFDAAAKIKVIKEVRACTDLGLKDAKDLVEKAPTLLKKGVTKDEAEKIIEKMKAIGAKVSME